jgi:hypothetical protein
MGFTDDTVAVNIFLYKLNGSTVIPIGLVTIPLSSGNTVAAKTTIDLLDSTSNLKGLSTDPTTGKQIIRLSANEQLKFSLQATMTSTKKVYVTGEALDAVG